VRFSDMVEGTCGRWCDPIAKRCRAWQAWTATKLRNPPPGKVSPLPSGSTQEDANQCGTALIQMGRCYRPIAYSPPPIVGTNRSIWGDVTDAWDAATDWTSDTASTAVSGMKQAGSTAGRFASALVDDGTAALSQASTAIKQTTSLLCTADDELRDLINAAAKAVPRFGKDQIKQCIATADRLAVIATEATNTITHSFSLIGTSIVNGVTYAWRVVVNGVMDAYAAIVGFLQKIGAEIEKIIKYLAWLFNWNDFLKASDKIYSAIETELGKAKDQIAKVSSYKAELKQVPDAASGRR
jgi:hypothetical protein